MGLETASFINGLVTTNPVGATDPKGQGDDHIRLIKSTLKATFPAITGAMTLTHTFLNGLFTRQVIAGNGLNGTGNLQADITLSIATPSTLTLATTNSAAAGTHSHQLSIPDATISASGLLSAADKATLGSGLVTLTGAQTITNKAFTTGNTFNGTLGATTPAAVFGTNGTFTGTLTANQNFVSSSVNVVLATTGAGSVLLRPVGVGSGTGQMIVDSAGTVTASGNITAFSDRKLKRNIRNLNRSRAIEIVKNIAPVTFEMIATNTKSIGFVAQEVREYVPELVNEYEGILSLAYPNMVAILWEAVRDLQEKVAKLESAK